MASAPAFTGKQVSSALQKKGFAEANKHHKFLVLYVDGVKTPIRTKVSHGAKTYTGHLAGCLRRDLKVGNAELTGLVSCTMSGDEYVEYLRANSEL